jgi:tagatose-1,6-bisphosphate aldolase non-catalytic subunit AgaZ/GatZ
MKFKDYLLLETPLLVDLANDSELLAKKFKTLKNKDILKEELFGDYKILYYPSAFKDNVHIILFNKTDLNMPLLYISQYTETILSKKLVKNAYINKAKSLDSNIIHDVLFHLLKNCDGMILESKDLALLIYAFLTNFLDNIVSVY